MTPAELNTELTTDPVAVGYAPYVTAGNDNMCAELINALTGPGAATITLTSQSKGAILTGLIPALDQLASGVNLSNVAITAAMNTKWMQRFNALRSGNDPMLLNAQFMGLLGQLVPDGIMSQANIDAFTQRTGSRAEVLWGSGAVVQPIDVQHAMGR